MEEIQKDGENKADISHEDNKCTTTKILNCVYL